MLDVLVGTAWLAVALIGLVVLLRTPGGVRLWLVSGLCSVVTIASIGGQLVYEVLRGLPSHDVALHISLAAVGLANLNIAVNQRRQAAAARS